MMDEVLFLTGVTVNDRQVPPVIAAAPTSLTATADSDSINLAWTNGDTYSSTVIERKDVGDYTSLNVGAGNLTSFDDTTAVVGTTYTYRVRGVKATYPTPFSNTPSAVIVVSSAHSASFDGSATADLIATGVTGIAKEFNDAILIGAWIKPTVVTDSMIIGDFQQSDDTATWQLFATTNAVSTWMKTSAGTNAQLTSSSTAITANNTYFVLAWFDPADAKARIRINGGAVDASLASTESAYSNTTNDVELGGDLHSGFGQSFSGLIDEVFVCKNPPVLATALTTINTLYNSGTGTRYASVTSQQKTDMGLLSWWGVDETSGTRFDLNGSINLTVVGSAASGTALVS